MSIETNGTLRPILLTAAGVVLGCAIIGGGIFGYIRYSEYALKNEVAQKAADAYWGIAQASLGTSNDVSIFRAYVVENKCAVPLNQTEQFQANHPELATVKMIDMKSSLTDGQKRNVVTYLLNTGMANVNPRDLLDSGNGGFAYVDEKVCQ